MNKNSKILVTGASGMLGHHVMRELKEQGYTNVKGLCSADADLRFAIETSVMMKQEEFGENNIDCIIHLAADCGGIGYNAYHPWDIYRNNLMMFLNLMHYRSLYTKMVCVGSCCSYPSQCPLPFKEDYLFTNRPHRSNEPYGQAKLSMLSGLEAFTRQYPQPDSAYLIPANMSGEHDNFSEHSSHIIPAIILKCHDAKRGNNKMTVWGDGTPTREILYAGDCAKAIILAMEQKHVCTPINVGTGVSHTIKHIVELIAKKMDFNGEIIWDTSKPNGQMRRQLCVEKAKRFFGFEAKTSLEETIDKTIKYFLEYFLCK